MTIQDDDDFNGIYSDDGQDVFPGDDTDSDSYLEDDDEDVDNADAEDDFDDEDGEYDEDPEGKKESTKKRITGATDSELLQDIWEDEEESLEEESEEEQTKREAADKLRMATALKEGIDNFQIGEDDIPEDFDINDPKQMRTFMTTMIRKSMASSIQLMFAPVTEIMNEHRSNVGYMIDDAMSGAKASDKGMAQLERQIPAARDKDVGSLVKNIYKRSLTKSEGDTRKAIHLTKQMVKQLGLKGRTITRKSASESGGRSAGLDGYAPRAPRQAEMRKAQRLLRRRRTR